MWELACPRWHRLGSPELPRYLHQYHCRSELAREKLTGAAFIQEARVIVEVFREQASSHMGSQGISRINIGCQAVMGSSSLAIVTGQSQLISVRLARYGDISIEDHYRGETRSHLASIQTQLPTSQVLGRLAA